MKTTVRGLLGFVLLAMCFMLWGCEAGNAVQDTQNSDTQISEPQPSENAPKQAVDFSLPNINGETITLSSLKGQKVLLDFWATWCPPCRSELPDMNGMVTELKNKGIVVLNISVDGDIETVKRFIERYHYSNLSVLFDDKAIAEKYSVSAIPTKILIDETGIMIAQYVGALSGTELQKFLELN